jgi:hypothetical protein
MAGIQPTQTEDGSRAACKSRRPPHHRGAASPRKGSWTLACLLYNPPDVAYTRPGGNIRTMGGEESKCPAVGSSPARRCKQQAGRGKRATLGALAHDRGPGDHHRRARWAQHWPYNRDQRCPDRQPWLGPGGGADRRASCCGDGRACSRRRPAGPRYQALGLSGARSITRAISLPPVVPYAPPTGCRPQHVSYARMAIMFTVAN